MFDRRLVTDIGLALLFAVPATLPAAPGPWSIDNEAGRALQQSTPDVIDRDYAHGALARSPRSQGDS